MFEKLLEVLVSIAAALNLIAQNMAHPAVNTAGVTPTPATPFTLFGVDPAAGPGETAKVDVMQTPAGPVITNIQTQPNPGVNVAPTLLNPDDSQFVANTEGMAPAIGEQLIHTGPENAGEFKAPADKKPAAGKDWDPTTAEKQGSYRTADKQDAITAKLAEFNITAPKSWTWAKKHQAILDHVAQFGASVQMTWADFEVAIKQAVAEGKRDAVLQAVQQIEGHQVVAQANVQPANYQKILDLAATPISQPSPGADQAPTEVLTQPAVNQQPATLTVPQAAGYQPGVTPVVTPEDLGSYARYLMTQGVTPAQVQAAIAPIAQGITYVPAERVPEAAQALFAATGK